MQWSCHTTKQKLRHLRNQLQRLLPLQQNESQACLLLRILKDANLLESEMYAHEQKVTQNRIRLECEQMEAWLGAESAATTISACLKEEVESVEQMVTETKNMREKKLAEELLSCRSSLRILQSLSIEEEKAVNKMANYKQVETKVQELKRKYLEAFDQPEQLKYKKDVSLLHSLRPSKDLATSLQRDCDTINLRLANRQSRYAQLRMNHTNLESELTQLKLSRLQDHTHQTKPKKRIEVPQIFKQILKLAAQNQSITPIERRSQIEQTQENEAKSVPTNTLSETSQVLQNRKQKANLSDFSSVSPELPCWMHFIIGNILLTILIVLML